MILVNDYLINGLWVKSTGTKENQKITHSGRKWDGIASRCKINGAIQNKFPAYRGCVNKFKDFQNFANWHTQQTGYGEIDEKGNKFNLDKDLLFRGNKIYSSETCVLLPSSLNSLIINRSPTGIYFDKSMNKYRVQLRIDGLVVYLGKYINMDDAVDAYKVAKELEIKRQADIWKHKISTSAYDALMNYEIMKEIT